MSQKVSDRSGVLTAPVTGRLDWRVLPSGFVHRFQPVAEIMIRLPGSDQWWENPTMDYIAEQEIVAGRSGHLHISRPTGAWVEAGEQIGLIFRVEELTIIGGTG